MVRIGIYTAVYVYIFLISSRGQARNSSDPRANALRNSRYYITTTRRRRKAQRRAISPIFHKVQLLTTAQKNVDTY